MHKGSDIKDKYFPEDESNKKGDNNMLLQQDIIPKEEKQDDLQQKKQTKQLYEKNQNLNDSLDKCKTLNKMKESKQRKNFLKEIQQNRITQKSRSISPIIGKQPQNINLNEICSAGFGRQFNRQI
ncbi:hypothetical protein PPERSA_12274 [Pseudocohnilembus persalinus]|uniref:Uncharacterized protein n=1 Tax=Pseudocohnilembus persalinus TaxID=266149 RepID=A0A0V0R4X1_PSEPJ|nr:hypothetical protein PPERSA_12274 [Pseudocohnilembus persalinus]|eukprot:KRX09531.1 hypothetical protein PPERSA_12274 [Pseudocohnilembus persalinus]